MPVIVNVRNAALVGGMLLRAQKIIPTNAGDALYQVGKVIFSLSQAQVPVLSGTLKATGQISGPTQMPDGSWIVVITYGDPATKSYARIQHWNKRLHHRRGGRSLFLTRPANANRRNLGGKVLDKVKASIDGL